MNAVVGILGKKALGKLKKDKVNTNSDNPCYEKVPVHNKNGQIVKYKDRERPVPEELSAHDKKILKKVRKKAYRWDMGFRLCCFNFRFGWSAIIGIIPILGDILDILMAYSVVRAASKVDGGLPTSLRGKMMANIMLDFAIGFIPVIGDIGDAFFRANTRNAWLLDAYLSEKAKALREGQVRDPDSGSPHRVPVGQLKTDASTSAPTQPAPARTGGYLLSGRERQPDVEMGISNGPSGNHGGGGRGRQQPPNGGRR
ncbi:hypothetical protein B0H66DRAFT_567011 [Apodospora peruviana]|uniref:Ph domain-containing protein n=1 Tax=Apodospora peruviana TaxID=516989 RepID=A0AAE0HVQ9_9PEZI|nr:hypothetical protein B0H66DRAFT_567011 [Apodospora peruviana]